ncbi:uncharacterized protein LOC128235074 [Mya arenaria]|uniref:uncharacterized protein LOC128235074 n=1 Tax=Mya arenaria TaxID=6604 RepID=UPI0022DF8B0C|nr:uncharacterized protein LOC128235074 [Mya arenaria]XP_052805750.1 uncharacterized protein LOC128235074 [Mya arenaria]XP_052805751.1 uncharacterized protein LOC128235074 [Mya arenaria]
MLVRLNILMIFGTRQRTLGKKIFKIVLKKEHSVLRPWVKDIVNHFWHCCKVAQTIKEFVDGYYECSRGPLNPEERNKPWLNKKENCSTLEALTAIVLDKHLLSKIANYLNSRSTADLEGFNQHILMYCSKWFSYSPPVYRMRNLIAAIDHNNHLEREFQHNKDGSVRLNRVWNKKSGRWAVYPVKEKKTFLYIESLKKQILMCRLTDNVGMSRRAVMEEQDPRRISSHLGPLSPKPSRELYRELYSEQESRFKK